MDFKLPDIGEGVHEGEIVKWLVKVGDALKEDQPMVEVMTDKATVEIPSPVNGTVSELLVQEGQTIEVGKVIIKIAEGGAKAESPKPEAPKAAAPVRDVAQMAPATPAPAEADIPFTVLATPATRKLARDLSVNLGQVPGTGMHGRVTKEDVQLAHAGKQAAEPRSSHSAVATPSNLPANIVSKPFVQRGELQRMPLKGIRKRISEAMSHSVHTAAHFTYVEEVDMGEVIKLRKDAMPEAEKKGIKLTFLPFIMKALVPCLIEFPYLNSSLDEEKGEIILKGDYNIGVATDTPQGLMVPVIKNVDRKTIWEIAYEIHTLAEKCRTGKVAVEDLKGGTYTVTNAGSIGGVFATPVINFPEVAILGVNAIRKRPVVKNDQIVIGDVMFLSMSVDHRVVDGADAARFMNRLIYFLQQPSRLVFA